MVSNSYSDACSKLLQISMFGSKPGLERIKKLLSLLNNPQEKTKCILVGGTNGKGSTAIFLSSIISASGKKCALFLSPHIFSIRERIQINGENIDENEFASLFYEVYSKCALFEKENSPTFFEIITSMAFLHFAKEGAEFAVMEVGMGGRLDATNACEPILSIITSISLEHTAHLGKTIKKISFEKGGIMRANTPLICCAKGEAKKEIKKLAQERGAKFIDLHKYFHLPNQTQEDSSTGAKISPSLGAKFSLTFAQEGGSCIIRLNTSGLFQAQNAAATAIAAHSLGISHSIILNAITRATIPARWQKIFVSPIIIIDCAHNPNAFEEILPDLQNDFSPAQGERILIFGAMKDKDWQSELKILLKYFDAIILPRLPFERAANPLEIKNFIGENLQKEFTGNKKNNSNERENIANKKLLQKVIVCDASSALEEAKKLAKREGKILCIGSIYMLQYLFSEDKLGIIG